MDKQKENDTLVEHHGITYLLGEYIDPHRTYLVDYYDIAWIKRGIRVYLV